MCGECDVIVIGAEAPTKSIPALAVAYAVAHAVCKRRESLRR